MTANMHTPEGREVVKLLSDKVGQGDMGCPHSLPLKRACGELFVKQAVKYKQNLSIACEGHSVCLIGAACAGLGMQVYR